MSTSAPKTYFTGTKSSIDEYQLNRNLQLADINKYTRYLSTPTVADTSLSSYSQQAQAVSDYYNQLSEQAREQTSYDISGAYANYKKQQLGLLQNTQLGTGFKEQVSGELKSAYDQAYSAFKQEEASTLGDYASKLATSLESIRGDYLKSIETTSGNFIDFTNALYEIAGDYNINEAGDKLLDLSDDDKYADYGGKLYASTDVGGLGHFKTENGQVSITDEGLAFLYKALNSAQSAGILREMKEQYPEYYDWYMNNRDQALSMYGLDRESFDKETYEESKSHLNEVARNVINPNIDTDYDTAKAELDSYLKENKLTQEEYDTYLNKLTTATSGKSTQTWYVQGLGSGGSPLGNPDDVDVTKNGKTYDLLCSKEHPSQEIVNELYRISGADPNAKEPFGSSTWRKNKKGLLQSSNDDGGYYSNTSLVVYRGKMYLRTYYGWKELLDDHGSVKEAVQAFLQK